MIKITELFKQKIHPVIKALMISNILSLTGWAFFNPIFAIFVIQYIKDGSLKVIGLCWFIYFVVKGLLQLFISDYLDRVEGESDDYFVLLLGQFLAILISLFFLFARNVRELYLIFFLYGISDAFYVPSWNAIFTRYINPKRVSSEWALTSSGVNLSSAIATLIGTTLAFIFGFHLILAFVVIMQGLSLAFLLSLRKYFVRKKKILPDYYFPFKI